MTQQLHPAARLILRALYTTKALPGTDKVGGFTWNVVAILSGLEGLGLVSYREIPRTDGALAAQLTERGVKAYEKGLRMGVYTELLEAAF